MLSKTPVNCRLTLEKLIFSILIYRLENASVMSFEDKIIFFDNFLVYFKSFF